MRHRGLPSPAAPPLPPAPPARRRGLPSPPPRRRCLPLPQHATATSPLPQAPSSPHLFPQLRPPPPPSPRLRPLPPPSPSAPAAAPTFSLGSGHCPALQPRIDPSSLPCTRSRHPEPPVATTSSPRCRYLSLLHRQPSTSSPPLLFSTSSSSSREGCAHPLLLLIELTPIPPPCYLLPLMRLR
ncbi:hypothetical protein VPH35_007537 [Triticum aestivum]